MRKSQSWLAIGDSFTFIDAHLEESHGNLTEGYLAKAKKKLLFPANITNAGINGALTRDFVSYVPPMADFYTILLGTNDWWSELYPLGETQDYYSDDKGTTLAYLGILLRRIRKIAPSSPIFLLNPVERGHFVYQFDISNTAYDSTHRRKYGYLREYAAKILSLAAFDPLIIPVNLHDLSGFRPDNAVKYMLLDGKKVGFDIIQKLPLDHHFAVYPYPPECQDYTYDGLHPSEKGCAILGDILAKAINEFYQKSNRRGPY